MAQQGRSYGHYSLAAPVIVNGPQPAPVVTRILQASAVRANRVRYRIRTSGRILRPAVQPGVAVAPVVTKILTRSVVRDMRRRSNPRTISRLSAPAVIGPASNLVAARSDTDFPFVVLLH